MPLGMDRTGSAPVEYRLGYAHPEAPGIILGIEEPRRMQNDLPYLLDLAQQYNRSEAWRAKAFRRDTRKVYFVIARPTFPWEIFSG